MKCFVKDLLFLLLSIFAIKFRFNTQNCAILKLLNSELKVFRPLPICDPFPEFPLEYIGKFFADHTGCFLRRMQLVIPHERVAIIWAVGSACTQSPVTISLQVITEKNGVGKRL